MVMFPSFSLPVPVEIPISPLFIAVQIQVRLPRKKTSPGKSFLMTAAVATTAVALNKIIKIIAAISVNLDFLSFKLGTKATATNFVTKTCKEITSKCHSFATTTYFRFRF